MNKIQGIGSRAIEMNPSRLVAHVIPKLSYTKITSNLSVQHGYRKDSLWTANRGNAAAKIYREKPLAETADAPY